MYMYVYNQLYRTCSSLFLKDSWNLKTLYFLHVFFVPLKVIALPILDTNLEKYGRSDTSREL